MYDNVSQLRLLQQLCETQTEPCVIKDLEHRFIHANSAYCAFVGWTLDQMTGKNDLEMGRSRELVLGDPVTGWPGFWALDDKAVREGEVALADPIADKNITDVIRTPLKDDDGNTIALMVQLRDISAVRELEQQLASNANALQSREGDIVTLDSVLASLLACTDTVTLLSQLANTLVERTTADGAYIAVLHESGDFMKCVAGAGDRVQEFLGHDFVVGQGVVGHTWQVGHSLFLDDVNDINPVHSYPAGTQVFALPLYVKTKAVATLMVISGPESPDLSVEVPQLERICSMASIALANMQQIESTERSLKRSRALAEVSQALNHCDDSDASYDAVCQMLLSAVDASRASALLFDEQGRLYPHVSWGQTDSGIARIPTLQRELMQHALPQWTARNDQVGLIKRLDDDPRESAEVHAMRKELNIGSTVCAPLKNHGQILGVISVTRERSQCDFDDGEVNVFEAVVNQLSTAIERSALSSELKHRAFHDALTHLPNRHAFELELEKIIARASEHSSTFSVLFIDLDGFKEVNDSLGHAAGDQLLIDVTERFAGCLDEHDLLARMGGDEFAAIVHDHDECARRAEALLDSLDDDFGLDSELVTVGASIGISQFRKHGESVDALLRCADIAMYQAKRSGKGCIFTFDESLAAESRQRIVLEKELIQAIENKEFFLVYQPQVRCSDSQVVGLEALIRWEHPEKGIIAPNDFIPVAESCGLIDTIGAWVIDEAIRQLAEWHGSAARDLRVCINVAASQLQREDFCDQVLGALALHGAPPSLLELEVTESVVMRDIDNVVSRLDSLRATGIRIAIDDFGTGYSSLAYLQDLPLDVLKIDRTFVNRLSNREDQPSLVNTIMRLASGLGLETVAEGVEVSEQRDQIAGLGCDIIQGFLYSRPVPASEIPEIIARIESRLSSNVELRRAA